MQQNMHEESTQDVDAIAWGRRRASTLQHMKARVQRSAEQMPHEKRQSRPKEGIVEGRREMVSEQRTLAEPAAEGGFTRGVCGTEAVAAFWSPAPATRLHFFLHFGFDVSC